MSTSVFYKQETVLAEAMSYGEFLQYAEMDGEEYPEDTPGYLILAGEDSWWTPSEYFEEGYMEIGAIQELEPYQQRLLVERAVVQNHYNQLKKSFARNTFLALPFEMRELLQAQERAMARYLEVLNTRVEKFLQ